MPQIPLLVDLRSPRSIQGLSARFVTETGITRATVDTAIAGYTPEWKIDLAREHTRALMVERTANSEIATNEVSETVNK